ncbi:MAG: pantetheine-phosphate adenylyltransferase, partial [Firmicutes bacterium]|nr:pantetheine-phosphate adenylyltransferase [Bacillota bacterium]
MKTGVYPGSFDPVTLGHLDIIERGLKIVDKLVVGILNNSAKTPMFSLDERIRLMKTACEPYGERVEIVAFSGLLVDFLKEQDSTKVIRGLRAVTDFEYELQMAQANRS